MPESVSINTPFSRGSSLRVRNRLAKSAMSERLGTRDNRPTPKLQTLYKKWAKGGAGLLITGNVMVDRRALGEPNNVVVENEDDLEILKLWASAAQEDDTHCLVQINHPGRQAPVGLNKETVAPSAVEFAKHMRRMFRKPRALTDEEIKDIIKRFGTTSAICEKAGFAGVQMHAAHGYLISQFLSPLTNLRNDDWGGTPEKRRRFMLEVYQEIRRRTGPDFLVAIKINSADFQRGGFSESESLAAIQAIAEAGVDLIEISGGSYEAPSMTGAGVKKSTIEREAYFLEFAKSVRDLIETPLMVTGGFRTRPAMDSALSGGHLDLVGMGRPLAIDPDYAHRLLDEKPLKVLVRPIKTGIPPIDKMGLIEIAWYTEQLRRMGSGQGPKPKASGLLFFLKMLKKQISANK